MPNKAQTKLSGEIQGRNLEKYLMRGWTQSDPPEKKLEHWNAKYPTDSSM